MCKPLFALIVTLGLTTAASGCESNTEACKAYVQKVNTELETCAAGGDEAVLLNEDTECPSYLDEGDTSCTEYYDCLAANTSCNQENGTVDYNVTLCRGCI